MVWLLVIVGLGAFAPRVESELSRAGWQADGSGSISAGELAQEHFGGNASTAIQVVVHSTSGPVTEGPGRRVLARARAILDRDPRIAHIVEPQPGATLSKDGTTAVLITGANADPNEMGVVFPPSGSACTIRTRPWHSGNETRTLLLVGLTIPRPR